MRDFQRRSLGDIGAELWAEFGHVVGKNGRLAVGAGNGDIAGSRIEQVRVDVGIGIDQDALGGEALGDGEARDSAGTEGISQ